MTEEILSRGERTRSEILQAAHELFIQQGYHGTSMHNTALPVFARSALFSIQSYFVQLRWQE